MRGKDGGPALHITPDDIPQYTSRTRVHTTRRLVQHQYRGVTNHGDGRRQLALRTAAKVCGLNVGILLDRLSVARKAIVNGQRATLSAAMTRHQWKVISERARERVLTGKWGSGQYCQ